MKKRTRLAGIVSAEGLIREWGVSTEIDGKWYLARPVRVSLWTHIKAAVLVLLGKADALVWGGNQ